MPARVRNLNYRFMKFIVTMPSQMIGELRFTLVQFFSNRFMRPKEYRVGLFLDGVEIDSTTVTVYYNWAANAISDALEAFGLRIGQYRVLLDDYYAAERFSGKAEDFTVPLLQESVCVPCPAAGKQVVPAAGRGL